MRLRSLGSRHTDLKLTVSEQSSTRQRYKDLLSTQSSSSQRLHRWSQAEENPALQDILHQVHDLNMMWVEAQREFVGEWVWLAGVCGIGCANGCGYQASISWGVMKQGHLSLGVEGVWVKEAVFAAGALKEYKRV